ncbi:hypothetical protein [Streptomyces sp. t39]|uniref:hypothetical protein n=1 Tax=Streptomyces sp. t39 TaxID=1828156 RepID=UPI0011CEB088|nr:hypothetical protein [Streptomyces sp. t39]TXS52269.1 hypothetical protein EAO77_20935 [Streptomyces sp. t39]
MFGRLFGGGGGERTPADPHAFPPPQRERNGTYRLHALGDRRVLRMIEAAGSRNWPALKEAMAPFDLGHDNHLLGELSDLPRLEEWIGRPAAEDKEHRATALLISGARHIVWGWEARTSARAVDVTREQWRVFHERLEIAEEQLLEAAELEPGWIAPWRQLLTSGRGMSLGPAVTEARFEAALRRDDLDLATHLAWLSQLQPRWGGGPGEALAFARQAFSRAPEGHPLGCVIAMAYIEEWVESDDPEVVETPEIRAELRNAADRSILHPSYVRQPGWQYEFNLFGMALVLAGETHTVRRVFQALDGAYTEQPWSYFSDPEKQFARAHRRA